MAKDDFRKALDSANELTITFLGRKTGERFSAPVWFVNDGKKVYLIPATGTASNWYKGILKNPMMTIDISGRIMEAKAVPMQDKKSIEKVVEMFITKYGASDMKRYYPRTDTAVELSI